MEFLLFYSTKAAVHNNLVSHWRSLQVQRAHVLSPARLAHSSENKSLRSFISHCADKIVFTRECQQNIKRLFRRPYLIAQHFYSESVGTPYSPLSFVNNEREERDPPLSN